MLMNRFTIAEVLNESDKVLRRCLRLDLLIIDDMGLKKLPKQSGEYLFEISGRS
jgi:DNA replication protein DnaC